MLTILHSLATKGAPDSTRPHGLTMGGALNRNGLFAKSADFIGVSAFSGEIAKPVICRRRQKSPPIFPSGFSGNL
jgi:hypothetical protein